MAGEKLTMTRIGEATMTAAEEAAWVDRMRGRGVIVGLRDGVPVVMAPPSVAAPEPVCSVDGCGRGGRLRVGLCAMHYTRERRNGTAGAAVTTRQHPKPQRVVVPTPAMVDLHSRTLGRPMRKKTEADVAVAQARKAPKESRIAPSVACLSCPEVFWTVDGMRSHTVEAHGAHYHRWRLESPCGPWVRGECACGAVKQFPASDESWGVASSVGAAAR